MQVKYFAINQVIYSRPSLGVNRINDLNDIILKIQLPIIIKAGAFIKGLYHPIYN